MTMPIKTSRPLLLPTALLAFLPLGALGCARAGASEPHARPAVEPPLAVTTAEVTTRSITRALTLTGTLTPNRKSDVAADATGRIAGVLVERGSLVAAGAPLARLDRRSAALAAEEARAQAAAAHAQEALAASECARADKLAAAGAINDAEHDRSRAQCEASRQQAAAAGARARLADKGLGDATVRAPFRGLVADRFVSEGEYVRPDTRVATLVEVDPLRLELSVPEAAVAVLQRSTDVAFEVAAFPGETFHARVRYVGPAVRRQTRDLLVEAVVANPGRRLLPGMFATARLLTGAEPEAVIPATAVKHDGEVDRVYVVANGRAEERLVGLGGRDGDSIAVVSGLRPGERVVAPVIAALHDGAPVH